MAAIQDAARLMNEHPGIAALAGAAQGAQVAANLMAAGWTAEDARIVADAYRHAIALEIRDAQHAQTGAVDLHHHSGGTHPAPPTDMLPDSPEQEPLPAAPTYTRPMPIDLARDAIRSAAVLEAGKATRLVVTPLDLLVGCAFQAGQMASNLQHRGWSGDDAIELANHYRVQLLTELARVHEVREGEPPTLPFPGPQTPN